MLNFYHLWNYFVKSDEMVKFMSLMTMWQWVLASGYKVFIQFQWILLTHTCIYWHHCVGNLAWQILEKTHDYSCMYLADNSSVRSLFGFCFSFTFKKDTSIDIDIRTLYTQRYRDCVYTGLHTPLLAEYGTINTTHTML